MLQFIFGLPSSGKTKTILEKIKSDVLANKQVVLFVPEQFSFYTEKSILYLLGDGNADKVTVLSFTRLFDILSDGIGGNCAKILSDTDKIILMNKVLLSIQTELLVWGKYAHSLSFSKTILDTIGELKVNAVSPQDLKNIAEKTDKNSLKNKLIDTALIFENFDAILDEKFIDPVDKLTKVYRQLEKYKFFENKNVYFDSFKAFSGQQFKIIDRILSQADNVFIAINNETEGQSDFNVFSVLRKNIEKTVNLANKNNVKISSPIILNKPHFENEKLNCLERLMARNSVSADLSDTITVCKADTLLDEVEFAVREIRRLVREKSYRFKDFVIIARDTDKYSQAVEYVCDKNAVSCFFDKRISLNSLPFSFAVNSTISALNFSTENILRFHKCGFTELSNLEISRLENYTFLWNIDGDCWLDSWDMNPKGFGIDELCEEDLKEIAEINVLREKAIKPIITFKNSFKGNARQMSAAIVELLESNNAKNILKSLCERFAEMNNDISSDVLKQGYDSFMSVLDGLVNCFGEKSVSVSEFNESLSLALSIETVGVIPQFLDEVSFGSADRIQTARPKIAFILGANQGVFPKNITNNGIWAANERKKLIEMGMEISDNSILSAIDEEYLVYSNLCCASEKIYISYSKQNSKGEELMPSSFVNTICANLNPHLVAEPDVFSAENLPETERAVFSEICRRFANTDDAATLDFALADKHYLEGVNSAVYKNINSITPHNAEKLFGNVINLSATKMDTINNCRFSYFCKYGLRAKKLQAAEFNNLQRGNIAHYVLERIISDYKENISQLSDDELNSLTDNYIDEYLSKINGFERFKDAKVEFILSRISRSLKEVVRHIAADFRQSKFKPIACEFKIGFEDGLQLEFPYDKGKIKINGSIDRVDEFNGYIRIVDYKTNSKNFKLPDILYGLNMQMLIYLYALIRGQGTAEEKAAAILYMPAKRDIKDAGLAMNGLVKADIELCKAMDEQMAGEFVPKFPFKKDGSIGKSASYIEEGGFSEIFDYIEKIMSRTGNLISSGDIAVSPIDSREVPACKYCDFKSVCFVDENIIKRVPELSKDDVFKALKEAEI